MRSVLQAALSRGTVRLLDVTRPRMEPAVRDPDRRGHEPRSSSSMPSGPAAKVELSAEALRSLADEQAREDELRDLRRRLPTALREAEEERQSVEEQEALRTGRARSPEDERILDTLERWDREIRTHEASHVAAARGLAGTPSYVTVTGPDGRQYAVGGTVKVQLPDAGSGSEAELARVKAAATAVADPSAADLRVAAKAERRLQQARMARAAKQYEAHAGPEAALHRRSTSAESSGGPPLTPRPP